MIEQFVALASERAGAALGRALGVAAVVLIAGLFALIALAGLFAALFFWLEPAHGATVAALICAAVAFGLALVSALPLLVRRPKPPPQPTDDGLPQLLMQISKTSSQLTTPQLIVTAGLIGFTLFLSARRSPGKR